MRLQEITIFVFTLLSVSLIGQNMADYTGGWEGKIQNADTFNFNISIENLETENAVFKISNDENVIQQSFKIGKESFFKISINNHLSFKGSLSKSGKEINGFIKSGLLLYHVKLTQSNKGSFVGTWNILMVDKLRSQNFYLSLENGSSNDYEAYPIFGDDRFTGSWCTDFQKENDSISFVDFKTGLRFKGKIMPKKLN